MKRKYYFHRINAPLEIHHVVYRLWVGESVREQKLLTQIMAWAFAQGATVMSWSEDVDYYLLYEEDRLFSGRDIIDFGLIQADITAAECLQHIKANDWESFEKSLTLPKPFFDMMRIIYPQKVKFQLNSSQSSKLAGRQPVRDSQVLTEKSKNLSHAGEGQRTLISFI